MFLYKLYYINIYYYKDVVVYGKSGLLELKVVGVF